ncbi:MAG: hypothetical protein J2P18_21970, partial [Nocardia sp.]|nr:hypothetical protein [Nocardia sp.]
MKKTTRLASSATMALLATSVVTATATAAPAAPPAPADPFTLSTEVLPGVQYTSNTRDMSTSIRTPMGTLNTQGGRFQLKDKAGAVIVGAPGAVGSNAEKAAQQPAAHAMSQA